MAKKKEREEHETTDPQSDHNCMEQSNCFIVGDQDAAAPGKLSLPKNHPMPINPDHVAEQLTAQFKHWEEGVGEAHERLYRMLGNVYEWAPLVKSQHGAESRIVELINARHEPRTKIRIDKHTGEQLLLMLAAGFGPRANSNRNNWLKALRAAEQRGAERNRTVIENWFRDVGGIKSAGALLERETPETRPEPAASAEEIAKSLWKEPAFSIPVPLPLEAAKVPRFLELGQHVVLVDVSADGASRTMNFLGELEPAESMTAMAQHVRKSQERLNAALWKLNRYALKHTEAPHIGKMSKADVVAFADVAAELINQPAFSYLFDEGAIAPFAPEDASSRTRLQVVNPTFSVYDPGRFIEGAKEGALLPYRPDRTVWKELSAVERRDSELIDYLSLHLKPPFDVEAWRKYLDKQVEEEAERQAKQDAQDERRLERERKQLEDAT